VTLEHEQGQSTYTPVEAQYLAMQESPEFQDLRRRYRGWVLPVAGASMAWYFFYVLLTTYAPDFMSRSLLGNINVGLVMGLLQFASTFAVTAAYVRHADRALDPAAEALRARFEGERQ
jgi:uncharacterized membrane protein (DUF485 family)